MKKVYVGCALKNAPAEFIDGIERLKGRLRIEGFHIMDFLGLGKGDEHGVYEHDMRQIVGCDVVLGICDLPSLGLGFEISSALFLGKKVIAMAHRDAEVSRMIIGICEPGFSFHRYEDLEEEALALLGSA